MMLILDHRSFFCCFFSSFLFFLFRFFYCARHAGTVMPTADRKNVVEPEPDVVLPEVKHWIEMLGEKAHVRSFFSQSILPLQKVDEPVIPYTRLQFRSLEGRASALTLGVLNSLFQ